MAPRRLGRFTNVTGGEEREKSKEGLNKIKFMVLTVRGYGSTRVTPALDLQRGIIRITFPVHKSAFHT